MLLGKKGCQLLEVPPARENPEFPCFPGKALCAYDVQIFQSCFPRDNSEVEVEYRAKAGQKSGGPTHYILCLRRAPEELGQVC